MAFVNPYTFIPLKKGTPIYRKAADDEGSVHSDAPAGNRRTGVIHCTLTAKTPLSVPCVNEKTAEVDLPFFRNGDRIAIPGSSLRGCVRSVYEALTDSCLRTNDERFRSASSKKRPALLKWSNITRYEDLRLVDAERLRIVDEDMLKDANGQRLFSTGQKVAYTGVNDPDSPHATRIAEQVEAFQRGRTLGYFLHVHTLYSKVNGRMIHNHPSVFAEERDKKGRDKKGVVVDQENTLSCFLENVELFVSNSKDAIPDEPGPGASDDERVAYQRACDDYAMAKEYRDRLLEFLGREGSEKRMGEADCFPVWYASEEVEVPDEGNPSETRKVMRYQLSHAQLSRSVYPQTPMQLAGSRAQCISTTSLCPACKLFGFVSPNGQGAVAGRVRFSDATLQRLPGRTQTTRLVTLLEPRQSAFEFYLRNEVVNNNAFTPNTQGTELAGRKAYWHHPTGQNWAFTGAEPTKFNLVAETAPKGTVFEFDVYFNEVSAVELNQLIYALTYGEFWDDEPNGSLYCHKIGHGKPVGLGSVHIGVNSVLLRTYDSETGIYGFDGSDSWKLGKSEVEKNLHDVKAVRAVASFAAHNGVRIGYPTGDHGDVFEWFASNRERHLRGSSEEAAVEYKQVLKKLVDGSEDHSL